jgi:endonuclease/exonuclease/phosphatase family metal-dependent hydrolase
MRLGALSVVIPVGVACATFALLQTQLAPPTSVEPKSGLRIATYNIGWFSETATQERVERIRSVISNLQPDIIALEEIQSKRALERLFGPEWEVAILDDPKENQEEAIAIRKPLAFIGKPATEFPDPAMDDAFPGWRDVLRAVVKTPAGSHLSIYVVHMKSRGGEGGRLGTDRRRVSACQLLADRLKARQESLCVVLGDFNDSPQDTGVRALAQRANLANLMLPLYWRDYVTFGLHDLYRGVPIGPQVRGACNENERWRGGSPRYPDDLAVTQSLFDQILVSPNLASRFTGTVGVYCAGDALSGLGGSVTKDAKGNVSYVREGTLASDHLPVYADFSIPMR